MDTSSTEKTTSQNLRRSTRNSSGKALFVEPTPRGPLKRSARLARNQTPATAVNGSRDEQDEEPPKKKSRSKTEREVHDSGDENEMQVEESEETVDKNEDQEMDTEEDSAHDSPLKRPSVHQGPHGDVNLQHPAELSNSIRHRHVNEIKGGKPATTRSAVTIKPVKQNKLPVTSHHAPSSKVITMEEYRKGMEEKLKSTDNMQVPLRGQSHKVSQKYHVNNNLPQKQTKHHQEPVVKESVNTERSARSICRGLMWCFCRLMQLVLLSFVAVLVIYAIVCQFEKISDTRQRASHAVKPERFADHLSVLETQFPSQRSDVWKRSKIHLEKHLKTAQPTEPVSLIFTAGVSAEKTLRCLAQGLASSFSAALNGSVLHIDGVSAATQGSDAVKLDIDSQLQEAFEGSKPVAVINRFEELPPGSTLIFYRYCDHENAAYKHVFLLFTVLLPRDEVGGEQTLMEVEEMVQDYLKLKLVSSKSTEHAFNEMDMDKFGGLWSRISHLILPVVSEKKVEQEGC
ncbi:uncharacterized protein V6R79_009471 [Siganus canaliculatus]